VYARREWQRIERVPLDERSALPQTDFSYVLEDWLQRLCVKESFGEASSSLRTLLGLAPSARAAEEMNQRMAEYAEDFRAAQPPPPKAEEGQYTAPSPNATDTTGVSRSRPSRRQDEN